LKDYKRKVPLKKKDGKVRKTEKLRQMKKGAEEPEP